MHHRAEIDAVLSRTPPRARAPPTAAIIPRRSYIVPKTSNMREETGEAGYVCKVETAPWMFTVLVSSSLSRPGTGMRRRARLTVDDATWHNKKLQKKSI